MKTSELIEATQKLSKPNRVTNGKKFRLSDIDPSDTGELTSEDKPRARRAANRRAGPRGVAGRSLRARPLVGAAHFPGDGCSGQGWRYQARHVGRESARCQVTSFKAPSSEDLDHDYLWRCVKALPERGRIGFSTAATTRRRSRCVCIPSFCGQKLPQDRVTKDIWEQRFQDIRSFERYLTRNGTVVGNSSSMSRRMSSRSASSNGWRIRTKIGSFRRTTRSNVAFGINTWRLMKRIR